MSAQPEPSRERVPLTRERILRAAVGLADRDGIAALTMRNLAQNLGVKAMSPLHHVENKRSASEIDAILDSYAAEVS